MATIKDVIAIAKSIKCEFPMSCYDCDGYTFCCVNTLMIALEYLERGDY